MITMNMSHFIWLTFWSWSLLDSWSSSSAMVLSRWPSASFNPSLNKWRSSSRSFFTLCLNWFSNWCWQDCAINQSKWGSSWAQPIRWRESSNPKTGLILKRFKMRSMTKIYILRLIFKGSPSPFFKFCVCSSIVILCSNCSVTPTQSIVTRIYQIKSIFQPFNFAFGFLNFCMELITIALKGDLLMLIG